MNRNNREPWTLGRRLGFFIVGVILVFILTTTGYNLIKREQDHSRHTNTNQSPATNAYHQEWPK